jgi:cytochrome c2
MSRFPAIVLVAAFGLGAGVSGEQSAQRAQSPASADIREGRILFQQKCAVCHVGATRGAEPYGPKLSKACACPDFSTRSSPGRSRRLWSS